MDTKRCLSPSESTRSGYNTCQLKTRNIAEVHHLQHVLSDFINFNDVLLQCGFIWDVVVTSFSCLLLQFDGDTSHLLVLQSSHQMGYEPKTKQKFTFNSTHLLNISTIFNNYLLEDHLYIEIQAIIKMQSSYPAILFLKGLLGMMAISSQILLFVWKSRVRRG